MTARERETTAAEAYDHLALRYDEVPRQNRINAFLRTISLETLSRTFAPGDKLVELGCGTGDEALALAQGGVTIVATDPSREMIRIAIAKCRSAGLEHRARFVVSRASEVSAALEQASPFDGGFASFSLAYEPDLRPVAYAMHSLLRPGSPFLASVPSTVCLTELVVALAAGHPRLAGRRLRPTFDHRVGAHTVPIRGYTPSSLRRAVWPHFRLERVEGLAVVVPPAYFNAIYARLYGAADGLERLDRRIRSAFPFRFLGDHLLARLRRVP